MRKGLVISKADEDRARRRRARPGGRTGGGAHVDHDAAAYQVTVGPTGSTLVVGYASGSEEHPEHVGFPYDDVLTVLVEGQDCALVPGTSTPVAIDPVDQTSNSQSYVGDEPGAAGDHTTPDGLAEPPACRVPVQPGGISSE